MLPNKKPFDPIFTFNQKYVSVRKMSPNKQSDKNVVNQNIFWNDLSESCLNASVKAKII